MKKIIVLGSGLVGSVMANDLAKNYEVTSVDISTKNLEKIQSEKINKLCADVSEKDVLENLIKNLLKYAIYKSPRYNPNLIGKS